MPRLFIELGLADMAFRRLIALLLLCVGVSGCVTQSHDRSDTLSRYNGQVRILVMPADIELFELSMSGIPETNAQWTQQARPNFTQAVRDHLIAAKPLFVEYKAPLGDDAGIHPD